MSAEVRTAPLPAGADLAAGGPQPGLPLSELEVDRLRADFPILSRQINAHRLVYLDSAASAQCPTPVLAAMEHYVTTMHANVHRGVHSLSQWATDAYEQSRERVRR
ncbi:MAG TPA: aminotransferase class V-fold PLP-dependent enzyme, partial [Steroidobacteraceae bacterium]